MGIKDPGPIVVILIAFLLSIYNYFKNFARDKRIKKLELEVYAKKQKYDSEITIIEEVSTNLSRLQRIFNEMTNPLQIKGKYDDEDAKDLDRVNRLGAAHNTFLDHFDSNKHRIAKDIKTKLDQIATKIRVYRAHTLLTKKKDPEKWWEMTEQFAEEITTPIKEVDALIKGKIIASPTLE